MGCNAQLAFRGELSGLIFHRGNVQGNIQGVHFQGMPEGDVQGCLLGEGEISSGGGNF